MAKGKRDPKLEARWRELVGGQAKSGLRVRAFCVREGVIEGGFYAWRRELRLRDQEPATPKSAFVPVVVESAAAIPGERVTLELRGGRLLRLPASMTLEKIGELIRAIEGVPA